jgi:prevent-host-death family protein
MPFDTDLKTGVLPISKAASAMAALLRQSKAKQQPIVVTQKGYPTGVLLDIDLYLRLKTLAASAADLARPRLSAAELGAVADELMSCEG